MPKPRRLLVDLHSTPFYHCISRCVRRAYLCGNDPLTGMNFDHRKQWLIDRMKTLARIFAIDICSYCTMSNHFHLVLRIDADRGRRLSDEQVVEHYGGVFPEAVKKLKRVPESERQRLISLWRERLWDLSWYMRCLNEAIARQANREDGCTGRFWEGRFRSQALLDEGALLTCMSYVDLNPIRAGIADSLEASEFTSIRERLLAAAAKAATKEGAAATEEAAEVRSESGTESGLVQGAPWQPGKLLPFAVGVVPANVAGPWCRRPLPMQFEDYVALLRETAGVIRRNAGEEAELTRRTASALERVGLSADRFAESVREFGRSFFTMVGESHRIEAESERRGYRRRLGLRAARKLYRRAA